MYWRQYQRDGTGQDNYIASNNGGMYKDHHANAKGISIGPGMYMGNGQFTGQRQDVFPAMSGKTINYSNNGSGRDGYIANSNGGFYPDRGIAS